MSTKKILPSADIETVAEYPPSEENLRHYLQMLDPSSPLLDRAVACEYFRRLLVMNHLPPQRHSDELIKGLIECLKVDYEYMRRDAAWALTNCACCPHPICLKIISLGGIEALSECARTSNGETQDQACWAIGNLALDCERCQRLVRRSVALPTILTILSSQNFKHSTHRRNVVWAVSQIFRGGFSTVTLPELRQALQGISAVLYLDDEKLRADAAWAIAYLVDGLPAPQVEAVLDAEGLINRLVALLDDEEAARGALRAVGNLITGGDAHTQRILDAGLLQYIAKAYRRDLPIPQQREMMWILSNIAAGTSHQVDQLFECCDMVQLLLKAFKSDDIRVRKEVAWTVANALTGARPNRIRFLCSTNLLTVIPEILQIRSEPELTERIIRALVHITDHQPNYFYLFKSWNIITEVEGVATSSMGDMIQRSVAEFLDGEELYFKMQKRVPATYTFYR